MSLGRGKEKRVHPGPERKAGQPAEECQAYDTIEELFGHLDRALAENAVRVEATFQGRFGFPLEAYIDRFSSSDDEHGFTVQSFQLL